MVRLRIAAVLGTGQVLGRGALAVYTILMVRELTKAGYGDFAYALALVGIGAQLGDGGLSRLIIRDVARSQRRDALARELMTVRLLPTAVTAALLVLATAGGLLPFSAGFGAVTVAYLVLEVAAGGFENAAVGVERPIRFAVAQLAFAVGLVVAAAVVLSGDGSPTAAMAGLAAASAVKVAVHAAQWHRAGRGRPLRELPVAAWMRDALPFLGLAVLAAVYYRMGVVILHGLDGPVETAPYGAALRIFDAVAVVGGVGFQAMSPQMSRAHLERPEELWALWRRMMARTAAVAVPVAVLVLVFARPLAELLFGQRYGASAGLALAWLAPGMAFLILQNLSASIVLMADDRGHVLRLTAVNVLVALALNLVLIDLHGSAGAAAATTLAEALSFTTFALLIARRYRETSATSSDAMRSHE